MANRQQDSNTETTKQDQSQILQAPSISLPKGGGAIKGIGEKFSANPVTGTGSMSVPIALSPGRAGFGPQLKLTYDSGAGNGIFGLGWNIGLPSITRKTDKGLPRYFDEQESDIFLLAGAEDLVPAFASGTTDRKVQKNVPLGTEIYDIYRYVPRIEGGFALIERWLNTNPKKKADSFWRTISRDNITSWFGRTELSRVFDQTDNTRIFQWLLDESRDDKGNVIQYVYKSEDSAGVLTDQPHESNRNQSPDPRKANRYLSRILYGNTVSTLDTDRWTDNKWMFEAVFDYGDYLGEYPSLHPASWQIRNDPFSSYRSGFEIRTYRLCQRVLMFHHFDELGNEPYLVKSTNFSYQLATDLSDPNAPGYSQLTQVSHLYYEKDERGQHHSRQLPPLEFTYSNPIINTIQQTIAADQLENLPVGTQGQGYQWVDLDGEGLSGVLSEQGGAWHYKPNHGNGQFGPSKVVASKPAMAALSGGRQQLMDLAGDGEIDLVDFSGPTPGFHERTSDYSWKCFIPFASLPNIDWNDTNLRFLDLTGDGHADALITEQNVFTWYPSLEEQGFAQAQRVYQPHDEDARPKLVFADSEQTIFLADMCGDGLTDLVRIRNGETCYWPNLGYGKFGAKITFDNSPRFDHSDMYDPRRIRLADIDGSGPIDIIYLGRDGARLYFNRSGNSLSNPKRVDLPIATENLPAVQVADLLGNGTACLVWNSHLPADANRPVRYIDLMGSTRQATEQDNPQKHAKPHLLIGTNNNLGATTAIEYTPSTQFYTQDKLAGTPWVTRLPFPVYCVSKVTVQDKWRGTEFSSTYSYHHGYFDGPEREFRGFGRVEQLDIESYGKFAQGNTSSPYITDDQTLYQPPIKTITWYHTGAALDRQRILGQFTHEYFPARYPSSFKEKALSDPELPADLDTKEWREAHRACKGMMLRQEAYELDVEALNSTHPQHIPVRIYSAATHNCNIQRVQKRGVNPHAVFLVTESEALSYQYDLDLRQTPLQPDPRISHTLNLRHDKYGNPQQSITIAYGRLGPQLPPGLPSDPARDALISQVQSEQHIAYAETRYTQDCILPNQTTTPNSPIKHHRLRLPCEVKTYELKGIAKTSPLYFSLSDFRKYDLSDHYGHQGGETAPSEAVAFKQYHEYADGSAVQKRLVEHARTLYFDDADDIEQPTQAKPFGQLGPRGLKYEDYKLALTESLLNAVFQGRDPLTGNLIDDKLAWNLNAGVTARQRLDEWADPNKPFYLKSGYVQGEGIDAALQGQYWMRSGIAGFASDANRHFYLPEEYTDPFGNKTTLAYDGKYDLFIQSSSDALGNTSRVDKFDYRVLAPREMVDANDNYTEVVFDLLGLPVAAAIKGKKIPPANSDRWEGDDLTGFDFALRNPSEQTIQAFCFSTTMDVIQAQTWLGNATTRFVYHFGDKNNQWGVRMAGACSIAREQHKNAQSPLQVSLECSDGGGNVLMKKIQAEPEEDNGSLRWIINGLTVLNNKGKLVKQYEPYFSAQGFGCEKPSEKGVTPVIYYDAAGRTIRTEMPDGTFSRVEFSPWHVKTYDANDTAFDPTQTNPKHSDWFLRRTDPNHPLNTDFNSTENKRAADLVKVHANTPAITLLDSLGRDVISIAHNRIEDVAGTYTIGTKKYLDKYYTTYTKLDAEGKPLWIRDALGHLVMQYINPPKANNDLSNSQLGSEIPCYDIAGNLLFQHSMDAGDRWTINDAAGKPMFAWDVYKANDTVTEEKRLYLTEYDALHRPTALKLKVNNDAPIQIERFDYDDTQLPNGNPSPQLAQIKAANLVGQLARHYDACGLIETIKLDFKGSPLEVHRRLVKDKTATETDWQGDAPSLALKLSEETFIQITEYDALKRMTKLYNWHREGKPVAVYIPTYGERGVLNSERLIVGARKDQSNPNGFSGGEDNTAIQAIRYDAKGQRHYLKLGNGTITRYDYDDETYRLKQLRTTRPVYDPEFPKHRADLKDTNVLQQLRYTYDAVGNITEIYDEAYKPAYFQNALIEPQNLYEYDAVYRLISATGREDGAATGAPQQLESAPKESNFPITASNALRKYTQRYQYDAVGNIKQMRHEAGSNGGSWTRHYAYAFDDTVQPASNRLWQTWTGNDRTKAITYHYDSHGSMLNLANVSDNFKLQCDHRDMIAAINLGNGFAHYQYDAGKQRTRKWIDRSKQLTPGNTQNIQEERIYLGGLELYRRWLNGVLKEEIETLHLFDGEQRLLMVDQILETDNTSLGKRTLYRYTLSNHLGSSTMELDHQAELISYEEYHPYGTSAYRAGRNAAEVKLKRYRYTGMERDEESGLSYHSARFYLPWLGRWGSCDPIYTSDGVNLYIYVKSRPTLLSDSTGTQSVRQSDLDEFSSLPNWMQKKIVTGQVNDQVSEAFKTWKPKVKENENMQEESDFIDEIILGDLYEGESSGEGLLGQIAVGFIPVVGQVADVRDFAAAVHGNYKGTKGVGSIFFAGVAFAPGIGDFAKGIFKTASRLPPPRVLSEGIENINQLLKRAFDEGRHILKVDFFDKGNNVVDSFWVISGAGGKLGHTEYQAIFERMLKESGMDEKTVFIIMQGVLSPCTTRNGAHSCHDLLRLIAEKGNKTVVYSTEALRKDLDLAEGSIYFYDAGKGYMKKNVDEWTKAPKEVVKKIEDLLKQAP